ncbi:J domain-containing protein [Rhizobium sp. CCGE 510]|uniref:J domain-containing protein n=1 Tax=Rhizobium sp. CCGE 510 TaxID=1132836 RepID=UPI00056C4984|nr:J domain-containing protein [Rhizobium sp. CCGE 510]
MTSDSKIFVGLRLSRKKPDQHREPSGRKCQWDGCDKEGTHRAPVGADAEGLYLSFCSTHVSAYSRGYNFVTKLSDPLTARYQREAASGSRPTLGTRIEQPSETPLPSLVRSGTAKAINSRKNAAQSQTARAAVHLRKLKVLEAKAFEKLGLSPDATPDEIKSRYKQLLKMHHPDANDGDRKSEDSLRSTIEAHKILKLNGFC